MSLVRTIAGRSLRQRRARTLFSVAGVALGVATVVGVFTLDHNTVLGLSMPGLIDWRPALEVRPSSSVRDPRAELTEMPGVAGVSAFFQNDVVVRRTGVADAFTARLFGLDADGLGDIDAVRIAEGRTLERGAREREALIGQAVAEKLALRPGDEVVLAQPGGAAEHACVDGVIVERDPQASSGPAPETFRVVGILARENLGRRSQGAVVVVDYRHGRELYAGVHVEPVFWVRQDPAVDIERLRTSLGASFSYELNKSVVIGAAADERAFRNGVRMAGLLALVLGLYVIFHTLSMSLVERVREVATLHALGATRRQIARIFLTEAVAIAILAAVLGLSGGLCLARGLLLLGITTLGTGHHIGSFDVPWRVVLPLTGLGVGMALLGSIYPLLRARHTDTVAALRGEDALHKRSVARGFHLFAALLLVVLLPALYFVIAPVVGEAQSMLVGAVLAAVGLLALLVILPLVIPALLTALFELLARPLERLWPLSGRLAARTIRASPARLAVSAAALALVTAAFVGLKGMTASLRGEIVQWAERAIVDKFYVAPLPDLPIETLSAHLERRDPNGKSFLGIETATVRTYVPFLLLGLHPKEIANYGPCRDDPEALRALAQGEGVIVSERLARHFGYAVGDRVHVSNASGAVRDLTVVAVSDAYGYFPNPDERMYGVVGTGFMKSNFCLEVDKLREAAIVLAPGADADVFKAAIQELVPTLRAANFRTGEGLVQVHLLDIDRDFFLFDIILGLTAMLAGLGVLNGQLLATLERAKELGVLKALGVTRRQIAGTVLCESLVIGVLGGLVGTALGAVLTPVIVRALESLSGLDLPNAGAGIWLLLCPAGAIAVALAAAAYPIARMNRMDAVAAVRTG